MKHWTDETDRDAATFFAKLSEREIRRRQDLCTQQIITAHRDGNADALADLHRMEEALAQAMLVRL